MDLPANQQSVGNQWDQRCYFWAVCTPPHTDCWSKTQIEDCKPIRIIMRELGCKWNPKNLHPPGETFKVGTACRFWVNSDYIDKVAGMVNHSNLTKEAHCQGAKMRWDICMYGGPLQSDRRKTHCQCCWMSDKWDHADLSIYEAFLYTVV